MTQLAPCTPGTYRCPVCHATYEALGTETAILCDDRGRHRIVKMQPVTDADSREMAAR